MIPYGRQEVTEADIQAVTDVLRSPRLTQGPAVERFEKAVADYCGARHGIAVSSATAGLHLACLALRLGPGDRLWTVPTTYVATANCALYCGADIDFVDIHPRTLNMDPVALEQKLEQAAARGMLPRIVIPVHLSGHPCDMETIRGLSHRFGFRVIEDASHAMGSRGQAGIIGGCHHSDMTVFSFHPVKVVTSGEGGVITTNRDDLAESLRRLRNQGITRDPRHMNGAGEGPWFYQQIGLGYNYRLSDIHAALGASQMARVETYVRRRNELARRYDADLDGLPVMPQARPPLGRSSFHLYVIRVNPRESPRSRDDAFKEMLESGIGVQVHFIPVHTQPVYRRLGFNWGDFPQAEAYYREAMTLPLFPAMTDEEQQHTVHTLRHSLG
ncbi:MAG: UDP-4-amino-4,6-dideoxy-N-acetyl-beta-L-altrosamine transaminase [Acidobacteriota bacterium]